MNYCGRFAPSPSGPLHFGSLIAAMGSYLDAKKNHGNWLIRIEDIDPPREVAGAADKIIDTLDRFGFEWDEPVLYQSTRYTAYQDALHELQKEKLLYQCICSRSDIQAHGLQGVEGAKYPGTCRKRGFDNSTYAPQRSALRIVTGDQPISFVDGLRGTICQNIAQDIGDFILKRADGLFAYQLAVVIDDAYQGITDVVRGADLLTSTPRQIYLQRMLGLPTPRYTHLPLATDKKGRKLSKRLGSDPLNTDNPKTALMAALEFLGQPLPPEYPASTREFWMWAIEHWSRDVICRR